MEGVLDVIQDNCKSLTGIGFMSSYYVISQVGEDKYASFLCSYGSQLVDTPVDRLSTNRLCQVVKKCPNLVFKRVEIRSADPQEWRTLVVAGDRIERISFDLVANPGTEMVCAIAKCSNLLELSLGDALNPDLFSPELTNDVLRTLYSNTFPLLESLSLVKFDVGQQNISLISSKTSKLQTINFAPMSLSGGGHVFQPLVSSNKHLRQVRLNDEPFFDDDRSAESAVEILRQLFETFSKCHTLDLTIKKTGEQDVDESTLRHLCGNLPCRGVCISVNIHPTFYQQSGTFS